MTKDKEKKVGKDQLLLEASRLGNRQQLDLILGQMQQMKTKKKTNPLASLRKTVGPNSIRDPVTGFTCLHHASLNGHSDCVKLILDYGAKLNAVDYKGSSALHLAAWAGNLEVVKILLSFGSHHHHHNYHQQQPHSSSYTTSSPLDRQTQQSAGEQLQSERQSSPSSKQQQVDIDLCNNDNQTPLSLAAQFGHTQVVAELLAHGANVHSRNNQLESPLDLACLNGRLDTVDLLLSSSPSLVAELKRPRATLFVGDALIGLSAVSHLRSEAAGTCESQNQANAQVANTPAASSGRRSISSGWSTLLRAGRRDSSSQSASSGSNAANQSPLQRFNVASLSMRGQSAQRSPTTTTTAAATGTSQPVSLSAVGRRATLAATSAAEARPVKQSSVDIAPTCKAANAANQSSNDFDSSAAAADRSANACERLLDHSPLHYAVRRGHALVVHLLLSAYNANLLQVTSLGSVLHELALNNGKHSEMISLLFSYFLAPNNINTNASSDQQKQQQQQQQFGASTTNEQPIGRLDSLDKFLNLRNGQQKSVFEMLNEINNRSAQEMKRLIYESSEQVHKQLNSQLQHLNAIGGKYDASSQFPNYSAGININYNTNISTNNNPNTSHPQLPQSQRVSTTSGTQFSDMQQINSFVTMKRAPKRVPQVEQQQIPFCTQTIDRRTNKSTTFGSDARHRAEQVNLQTTNSLDHPQQFGAMTRSVSNLHKQQQLVSDWNQRPIGRSPANGDNNATSKKRRSKSRDLGSLLMEVKHQQQQQQQVPVQNQQQQQVSVGANDNQQQHFQQLVRSQTDCSHLMGRLFGEQMSSYSLAAATGNGKQQQQQPKMAGNELHQHPAQVAPGAHQQQQSGGQAVDWTKTINRHYHVYEQEFYPPRLLSNANQQQQLQRPMAMAVVPPLGRQHQQQEIFGSKLRASTRSNSYSISQQQQPSARWTTHTGPASVGACCAQATCQELQSAIPGSADSRLSLNLDAAHSQQLQQQHHHHPRDRFLSRHSRKVSVGGIEQQQPSPLSSHTKRQDLLELQQRLAIECGSQVAINGGMQQQQHHMPLSVPSSYSLESHLSESQLFESTRQALMDDFDRMIGRELLGGNNGINANQNVIDSARSSHSKLTGVSLDMDSRGERLTVSGTRLLTTVAAPAETPVGPPQLGRNNGSARSLSSHSSGRLSSVNQQQKQVTQTTGAESRQSLSSNEAKLAVSPKSLASTCSSSISDIAPPKPPRLSLLGKQKTCPSQRPLINGRTPLRAVIYDLPVTGAPLSAGSTGSSQQFRAASRHALTEPPRERPPPPPSATAVSVLSPHQVPPSSDNDAPLTRPLHVFAPESSASSSISASGSAASSSGAGRADHQRVIATTDSGPQSSAGLLKLAADADSGVGTSNSPASTGHDSEEMDTMVVAPSERKQRPPPPFTGEAVVGHPARVQQKATPPVRPPLPSGYQQQQQRGEEAQTTCSPPSPKTAQLCIEEALMPLAKTTDTANQTTACNNSTGNARLAPSYSSNDLVDRWLDHDSRQLPAAPAADYENCRQLQRQLRNVRCRSISNLLASSNSDDCGLLPSPALASRSSLGSGEEDEDYAAESASSASTTATSGLCPADLSSSRSGSPPISAPNGGPVQVTVGSSEKSELRKELTIKLVIDNQGEELADNCGGGNSEVFYVDPLELKKIAMKRSQTDAETLTDEELCAAIDKESGFIRFTLRKRRNGGTKPSAKDQFKHEEKQKLPNDIAGDVDYMRLKEESISSMISSNSSSSGSGCKSSSSNNNNKRTKLNISENDDALATNSDISADQLVESTAQEQQIVATQANATKNQDLNNNTKEQSAGNHAQSAKPDLATGGQVNSTKVELVQTQQEQTDAVSNLSMHKQMSTESSSSEVEMETSQTSASSSSSSSKNSIKSIVSQTCMRLPVHETDKAQAPTGAKILGEEAKDSILSQSDNPNEESAKQAKEQEVSATRYEDSPKVETQQQQQQQEQQPQKTCGSLVSEAAKRLEAAVAAQGHAPGGILDSRANVRPIAAARRTINGRPASAHTAPSDASCSPDAGAGASTNEVTGTGKRTANVFVPVKSVCWPPNKNSSSVRNSVDLSLAPVAKRWPHSTASGKPGSLHQDENMVPPSDPINGELSKEVVQQQQQSQSQQTQPIPAKTRPKPAPPAKPAKLAASKFSLELSSQRL